MKAHNTAEIIQAKGRTQRQQKQRLELPPLWLASTKAAFHIYVRVSNSDIRRFPFYGAIQTKLSATLGGYVAGCTAAI